MTRYNMGVTTGLGYGFMMKRTVPIIAASILTLLAVPAVAGAQEGCPIGQYLTEGRRGSDDVRCLQAALNAAGVDSGPVDGWYGPITRGAVVAYQTANGLTVDGEVGAQTAGHLAIWQPAPRGDAPEQRQANTARANAGGGGDVWSAIARCESGNNPSINTGNGYYGMYQFSLTSWRAVGGSGLPSDASVAEQTRRAQMLQDIQGWNAWPSCARRLGLL